MKSFREKRETFGFRKLAVGLVSTTIAAFFVVAGLGQVTVAADQVAHSVHYRYVAEHELTEAEKQLVVHELPKEVGTKDDVYYLVYRPVAKAEFNQAAAKNLPKTGNVTGQATALSLAGLALLVAVVGRGKNGRRKLVKILLLTSAGASILSPTILALTNQELAAYNQTLNVKQGANLPVPLDIKGYQYVGYLKAVKEVNQNAGGEQQIQAGSEGPALVPRAGETGFVAKDAPVETKPELKVETRDSSRTESIAFERQEVLSSDLPQGQEEVLQAGQIGERTIISREYWVDGELVKSEEISNQVSREPKSQIVKVGTGTSVSEPPVSEEVQPKTTVSDFVPTEAPVAESKPELKVEIKDSSRTESIAFERQEVLSSDLPQGQEEVLQAGQVGERTIISREYWADGELLGSEEISNQVSREPKSQIVKVGTGSSHSDHYLPNEAPIEETKPSLDLTALEQELAQESQVTASAIYLNDSEEDKQAYVEALAQARALLEQESSDQARIDELVATVQSARSRLDGSVDKSRLKAEYDLKAETEAATFYMLSDKEQKDAYDLALLAAKAVLDDPVASQEKINKTLDTLTAARQALNGRIKTKPTLSLAQLDKDAANRSVSLAYNLSDPDQTYLSAKVRLYKDDQLLRELPITDINQPLTLSDLDYFTDYRLETNFSYNLGQGEQESQLTSQTFELEYKKIEIKQVDEVELYKKENATFVRQKALAEIESPSLYYARVKSSRFKDLLLPVSAMEAVELDGRPLYRLTAFLPELVQSDPKNKYQQGYTFYVERILPPIDHAYNNFAELLKAISANPAGDYKLADNLDASNFDLPAGATSYITKDFSGSLSGQYQNKNFAIFGLKAPLFANIVGGMVSDLALKEVAIKGTENVGALAKKADSALIRNLAVQGEISANRNIGGIVFDATNLTKITNTSFTGKITAPANTGGSSNIGGLVGQLQNNSRISQSFADIDLTVNQPNNNSYRTGGLVGAATSGSGRSLISDSYVTGSVTNTGAGGYTAGILGTSWLYGRLSNVLSNVKVRNGFKTYGDSGALREGLIRNDLLQVYTGPQSSGKEESNWSATSLSEQEVASKIAAMDITVNLADSLDHLPKLNVHDTDYSNLPNYRVERELAYRNMEKLLPFYNKEYLVYAGNKLASDSKLVQTEILSLLAMKDNQIVSDYNQDINRLLIHYKDQTVAYLDLTQKTFNNSAKLVEYELADTGLLYTPSQFQQSFDGLLNRLLPSLTSLDLYSDEIGQVLGLTNDSSRNDKIKKLYLDEQFADSKEHLATYLRELFHAASAFQSDEELMNDVLVDYLESNKAQFLLGLSYLNRLYKIQFGELQFASIARNHLAEFYGKQADPLRFLVELGSSKYNALAIRNNLSTYEKYLSPATGQRDVLAFLDYNRRLFTNLDEYAWFKEATQDQLVLEERPSKEVPTATYKVYDRLKDLAYRSYILPLLTLNEGKLFITSNMSTITFSMRERHGDLSEAAYRERIKLLADRQQSHLDMWYRLSMPESKEKLIKSSAVATWGGYVIPNSGYRWYGEFGENSKDASQPAMSIREFFGPLGQYFKANGTQAYATGSRVNMIVGDILSDYDASVWTHEMVHNYDGAIYFNGYGRREAEGAEEYALGMLQSSASANQTELGFNNVFDWSKQETRLHNASNERFQTQADLQEYFAGRFDLLYLLDYAEGKSLIDSGKEAQKRWFNTVENVADGRHANNKLRPFTDEEWTQLNLQTVADLIEHQVIVKRYYGNQNIGRNVYNQVSMLAPIFASGENATGSPGGLLFKRMAFEILADKGYAAGFLPYVSNQLSPEAKAAGENLNDNFIIKKITNGQYSSLTDYKKALMQASHERFSQAKLKPITIRWNRQDHIVTSYAEIQKFMDEAVALDLRDNTITQGNSRVNSLKLTILQQYQTLTDDYRSSIFE